MSIISELYQFPFSRNEFLQNMISNKLNFISPNLQQVRNTNMYFNDKYLNDMTFKKKLEYLVRKTRKEEDALEFKFFSYFLNPRIFLNSFQLFIKNYNPQLSYEDVFAYIYYNHLFKKNHNANFIDMCLFIMICHTNTHNELILKLLNNLIFSVLEKQFIPFIENLYEKMLPIFNEIENLPEQTYHPIDHFLKMNTFPIFLNIMDQMSNMVSLSNEGKTLHTEFRQFVDTFIQFVTYYNILLTIYNNDDINIELSKYPYYYYLREIILKYENQIFSERSMYDMDNNKKNIEFLKNKFHLFATEIKKEDLQEIQDYSNLYQIIKNEDTMPIDVNIWYDNREYYTLYNKSYQNDEKHSSNSDEIPKKFLLSKDENFENFQKDKILMFSKNVIPENPQHPIKDSNPENLQKDEIILDAIHENNMLEHLYYIPESDILLFGIHTKDLIKENGMSLIKDEEGYEKFHPEYPQTYFEQTDKDEIQLCVAFDFENKHLRYLDIPHPYRGEILNIRGIFLPVKYDRKKYIPWKDIENKDVILEICMNSFVNHTNKWLFDIGQTNPPLLSDSIPIYKQILILAHYIQNHYFAFTSIWKEQKKLIQEKQNLSNVRPDDNDENFQFVKLLQETEKRLLDLYQETRLKFLNCPKISMYDPSLDQLLRHNRENIFKIHPIDYEKIQTLLIYLFQHGIIYKQGMYEAGELIDNTFFYLDIEDQDEKYLSRNIEFSNFLAQHERKEWQGYFLSIYIPKTINQQPFSVVHKTKSRQESNTCHRFHSKKCFIISEEKDNSIKDADDTCISFCLQGVLDWISKFIETMRSIEEIKAFSPIEKRWIGFEYLNCNDENEMDDDILGSKRIGDYIDDDEDIILIRKIEYYLKIVPNTMECQHMFQVKLELKENLIRRNQNRMGMNMLAFQLHQDPVIQSFINVGAIISIGDPIPIMENINTSARENFRTLYPPGTIVINSSMPTNCIYITFTSFFQPFKQSSIVF